MAIGPNFKRKVFLKNVLQDQKVPFKSKHSIPHLQEYKKLFKTLLFLTFITLSVQSTLQIKNQTTSLNTYSIKNFKVNFLGNFPENVREKIFKDIERILNTNMEKQNLEQLSKTIQEKSGMSQVHVFMDNKRQISIFVIPRSPLLRLAGNSGKVLSSDGEIYEDFNFSPKYQATLSGIFENEGQMNILDEKNCVKTTEKEKKILLDILQLLTQASEHSLEFSSIDYKKYRGFACKILNTETTVVFGFPPYERQFQRLFKILEDAKKKDVVLKTIEVDFNDKAFITEYRK